MPAVVVAVKPLSSRVVLRREKTEEMTPGGIALPGVAQDKQSRGEVLAVGPGRWEDGAYSPMHVRVGDKVLFSGFAPEVVQVNDEELLLIDEHDILAIVD